MSHSSISPMGFKRPEQQCRVIVVGNEKGGSGKSTVAMHLTIALCNLGYKVGSIDLDTRQATFTRFLQNRVKTMKEKGFSLECPMHLPIEQSIKSRVIDRVAEEERNLSDAIQTLKKSGANYIVIDTPGTDNALGRLGHKYADTLVTPINDSFVDLDLIARVNGETLQVERPSVYSDMVWSLRKNRALNGQKPIDWFIIRNRLSHIRAKNREHVETILKQLERRFAFVYLDGLSERVIYRQLFLQGLTLLDLNKLPDFQMRYSHISGRQEMRRLLNAIGIKRSLKDDDGGVQSLMAKPSPSDAKTSSSSNELAADTSSQPEHPSDLPPLTANAA